MCESYVSPIQGGGRACSQLTSALRWKTGDHLVQSAFPSKPASVSLGELDHRVGVSGNLTARGSEEPIHQQ